MAVPDYQSCMLPLMQLASDGQEHSLNKTVDALAQQFHLTDGERDEMLPSGRQAKFDNRVGWARTYLTKAGLLAATGRGRFRITPRGMEVLVQQGASINTKFLYQFPEFREFQRKTSKGNGAAAEQPSAQLSPANGADTVADLQQTPQEVLETSYQSLRRTVAEEVLERVKGSSPRFFERLVIDLLVAMGYGGSRQDAGQAIGQSGDEGIDGIIKEDKLGA